MQEAAAVLYSIIKASWSVLLDAAPFVLIGFFVAGLVKAFVPENFVATHLGGGIGSIFKASAIGIPIPLCSCGVVPAAAGLKKQGAGKGAVASFLVSTPETGVDSIAVTYALLDPVITVFRPIAAIVTAIAVGISVSFAEKFGGHEAPAEPEAPKATSSCSCGCSHSAKPKPKPGVADKFREGMSFAFGDLLGDVGAWLFVGVLLAGIISVFVSPQLIEKYLSNEFLSMAMMLAISVPLYVCATSSTPIVAALALKGISPGAALVFLIAGPATNAASLPVISKLLGKRATLVYLAVIVVMSFFAGILINKLYAYLGLDIRNWVRTGTHEEGGIIAIASAIVLTGLVLKSYLGARFSKHGAGEHAHHH
ncbi:MAG: SO_0444 family Cu/Zn efflux transporter [Chlorobiaceae bacterium]|nr:SO_0444 family Cu/Zn efflux transporter [Chlorobiaceae bacterium]